MTISIEQLRRDIEAGIAVEVTVRGTVSSVADPGHEASVRFFTLGKNGYTDIDFEDVIDYTLVTDPEPDWGTGDVIQFGDYTPWLRGGHTQEWLTTGAPFLMGTIEERDDEVSRAWANGEVKIIRRQSEAESEAESEDDE